MSSCCVPVVLPKRLCNLKKNDHYQSYLLGVDFRVGSPGMCPPIIEKRPCICHFLPPCAPPNILVCPPNIFDKSTPSLKDQRWSPADTIITFHPQRWWHLRSHWQCNAPLCSMAVTMTVYQLSWSWPHLGPAVWTLTWRLMLILAWRQWAIILPGRGSWMTCVDAAARLIASGESRCS